MVNGVNVSDPTRQFENWEMSRLREANYFHVIQQRRREAQGDGRGRGRGQRGGRGRGPGRAVQAVEANDIAS